MITIILLVYLLSGNSRKTITKWVVLWVFILEALAFLEITLFIYIFKLIG